MGSLKKCSVCKKAGYSYCKHISIQPEKANTTSKQQTTHTPTAIKKPLDPRNSFNNVIAGNANAGESESEVKEFLNTYREHSRKVRRKLRSSLKRRNMPKEQYRELARSLGLIKRSNWECAANITGRIRVQNFLVQEFKKQVLSERCQKYVDYYFVTFCDDRFATLELNSAVDLYALKEKVRQALRSEPEFHYIGFVDVTSISNFPRDGLGECLLFEIHIIAWKVLDSKKKRRKIYSDGLPRGFKTNISKQPVKRSPTKKRPTPLRAMAYVGKSPYWSKRILTSMNKRTGEPYLRMEDNPLPNTMRFISMSRVLSNHTINELIISKGAGDKVVNAAIERLRSDNPCPPRRTPKARREMRARSEQTWLMAQTPRVRRKYNAPKIRLSRIDPEPPKEVSKEIEPWLDEAIKKKLSERLPKKL